MKILVLAKPKKKNAYIEQVSETEYLVSVKEPPVDGKANQAIIKSLSNYFGVSPSQVTLISGHTSKKKIFEVPDSLSNFEPLPKQKKLF